MARVAIVTGGTRGIGEAISLALKEMGFTVAANYGGNDAAAAQFKADTGISVYKWDVGDHQACLDGCARVEADLGPIDIVVNNAGYLERCNLIADSDPDEWWNVWNVNVRGTYHVTRAFLPLLIECDGDKTIVNVSSTGAHSFSPRYSAYSVSVA